MLVVGKKASTLSTLHGIANCVKNRATRKVISSNRCQRLARCSVAQNYFWLNLRILFAPFLETKTQLWKLIWAILGCCIGSSGSLLHRPLKSKQTYSKWLRDFAKFAYYDQEGLNKKEIQRNLCNIFSISIFNEFYLRLVTLNRVTLGRTVTFMKCLASVISLIFLPKTLIWNKITFPASYSLNFA